MGRACECQVHTERYSDGCACEGYKDRFLKTQGMLVVATMGLIAPRCLSRSLLLDAQKSQPSECVWPLSPSKELETDSHYLDLEGKRGPIFPLAFWACACRCSSLSADPRTVSEALFLLCGLQWFVLCAVWYHGGCNGRQGPNCQGRRPGCCSGRDQGKAASGDCSVDSKKGPKVESRALQALQTPTIGNPDDLPESVRFKPMASKDARKFWLRRGGESWVCHLMLSDQV